MDELAISKAHRWTNPEAHARDTWVEMHARRTPSGSRVLDAGAGASKYSALFGHCVYETQDFCQYQGPLVRYVKPVNYVCDITQIPLAPQTLDLIVCTEVIEHIVDPPAALAEFARLLKPGAKLLLTAPMISHIHMEPYHYFGGFTRYWYQHWLPARGFEILSVTPVGGPGRSCVAYAQAFHLAWSAREKKAGLALKTISRIFRVIPKVLCQFILPRTLPLMDPWLGSDLVCSGFMVEARRTD